MLTRRSFARMAALIPALAIPAIAKPKVIRLRDIEHEYDPTVGSMGRGVSISWDQVDTLDTTGYRPFVMPGTTQDHFPCLGRDGKPNGDMWFGWVREENGKHLVAAIEVGPPPKTHEDARAAGWHQWSAPGTGQAIFLVYHSDGTLSSTRCTAFFRGPIRMNYEVPA